jgi:SSS family solute:Na+ symporter
MQTHFTALDVLVLVVYFAATMAFGFVIGRRNRSVEGYTAAGRRLPGWLTGLSILGTYVSSISFLALPGKAFASNWNSFVFSLSIPLAAWIAVRWFVPYYRSSGEISAYSHLEHRFGAWARLYASACYLLTQLARMGTVMYLMALPLHVLLGWPIHWIILVTGVSVTLYTYVGGLTAVIWTDALQTVILIVGASVCLAIMVGALPGGVAELVRVGAEYGKFGLGEFGGDLTRSTFWVVLVYGLVINLQNFGIDQNYVQRYLAAKSDRDARRSVWLGGLLYVPLSGVFFLIGTALFAYYLTRPEELPEAYRDPAKSDSVFPWFIVTVLPPGVTGLLVAAIFAAAMSTVSTSLNSSATIIVSDFVRRFRSPKATDTGTMRILHGTTFAWGIAGTCVALAMTQVASALDAWWKLSGIFAGGTLGLFLLGFVSRRPDSRAALVAVTTGVVVILWLTLSPGWSTLPDGLRSPFHGFLTIVFGTASILLVGLALGVFLPRGGAGKPSREQP